MKNKFAIIGLGQFGMTIAKTLSKKGAEVISSSFDSIYPKGILIGKVISINSNVNSNFYDIEILSSQSFYNLSTVYVYNNSLLEEKKNLEQITDEE